MVKYGTYEWVWTFFGVVNDRGRAAGVRRGESIGYWAMSIARVSRTTVTRIWPG